MSIATRLAMATLAVGAAAVPLAAEAGTITTLYTFKNETDGATPFGPLIYHGGKLFGGTPVGNGTVYQVNASTGAFKLVYSFKGGPDGAQPFNGVTFHDGLLYGSTNFGGANANCSNDQGCGTLFSINPATGAKTTLYDFPVLLGPGPLTYVNGAMFASTYLGGANGDGSVISWNTATGTFTTVYSFGGADGVNPKSPLLYHNATLFGTTAYGGVAGYGTVFSLNPVSGTETVIHSFSSRKDGRLPYFTNLVYHANSLLGDTENGGKGPCRYGCGVAFAINLATGRERILSENIDDGSWYYGATLVGGTLYETLPAAGPGAFGEIVQVDLKSKQETVLYTFTGGADGGDPMAPLVYQDGVFYGTTYAGGILSNGHPGFGTVFKFVP